MRYVLRVHDNHPDGYDKRGRGETCDSAHQTVLLSCRWSPIPIIQYRDGGMLAEFPRVPGRNKAPPCFITTSVAVVSIPALLHQTTFTTIESNRDGVAGGGGLVGALPARSTG